MTDRPSTPTPPDGYQEGWGSQQPQMSQNLAREYARINPRAQYRRARTRRQTIIFGAASVGLIAAFVFGAMGMLGMIPNLFGADFSKKIVYAETGDTPCPSAGARPVSPEGVSLRILNTTSTPGLAGSVGSYFKELGYTIANTDNAAPYRGAVEIGAGPRGVDAAYTLARYLGSDVRIRLNQTEDMTLTVLLGQAFEGVPDAEETEEISASNYALVPLQDCLPVKYVEPLVEDEEQSGQSGELAQSGETEDEAE